MEVTTLFRLLPFAVLGTIALVVGGLLFQVARYGSFKGANFGAAVRTTVGQVDIRSRLPRFLSFGLGLRVNVEASALSPRDPDRGPHVGLMVRVRVSALGFPQLVPLALTRDEARELAELLTRAAG